MTNTVTPYDPGPEDDGFRRGSFNSGRLIKGTLIAWNDVEHWHDRDGSTPPSPMLAIKVNEVLQRFCGDNQGGDRYEAVARSRRAQKGHPN
jgi:hypothetical protein